MHDRGQRYREAGGIIADYAEWNVVKLTYCTQDLYAGSAGRAIVRETVQNLPIQSDARVLIVGQSAGAVGITSNLDTFDGIEASEIDYVFDGYIALPSTIPDGGQREHDIKSHFGTDVILPTPGLITELDGFVLLNKNDRVVSPDPIELRRALAELDHYSVESADHVMTKGGLWLWGQPSPADVVERWLATEEAAYSDW